MVEWPSWYRAEELVGKEIEDLERLPYKEKDKFLRGLMEIDDSNQEKYAFLLRIRRWMLYWESSIYIEIEDGRGEIGSLLHDIERLKSDCRALDIWEDFRDPYHIPPYAEDLKKCIKRNFIETYRGVWLDDFEMCETMEHLSVTVRGLDGLLSLQYNLDENGRFMQYLHLCLSGKHEFPNVHKLVQYTLDEYVLEPIRGFLRPTIYFRDLTDDNVPMVIDVLERLRPVTCAKKYWHISLPECHMTIQGIENLIAGLIYRLGRKIVGHSIRVPEELKPDDPKEVERLETLVKENIHSGYGLIWLPQFMAWEY